MPVRKRWRPSSKRFRCREHKASRAFRCAPSPASSCRRCASPRPIPMWRFFRSDSPKPCREHWPPSAMWWSDRLRSPRDGATSSPTRVSLRRRPTWIWWPRALSCDPARNCASPRNCSMPRAAPLIGSTTIKGSMDDIFALEDGLTNAVVAMLSRYLSQQSARTPAAPPLRRDVPASPKAFELFLRGMEHAARARRNRAGPRRVSSRRGTEDPRFAPRRRRWRAAIASTASTTGSATTNESLCRAGVHRAFESSPDLPLAHRYLTHFESEGRPRRRSHCVDCCGTPPPIATTPNCLPDWSMPAAMPGCSMRRSRHTTRRCGSIPNVATSVETRSRTCVTASRTPRS